MATKRDVTGPDLTQGIESSTIPDGGMFTGHVGDDNVLIARRGAELFAVTAKCTHYSGDLGKGLVAGDTVRCPLHHSCFSLRTGEALMAPAFDPIACWRVDREGDRVFVREKLPAAAKTRAHGMLPTSIVIIGGGAAGFAAAEMLRREGYGGAITIFSEDTDAPYDRPNLSKDFLGGDMPPDWLPLQSADWYRDQKIDLVLGTKVTSIDTKAKRVVLANGQSHEFGALLLATGADPIRLPIPGAVGPRVRYLRSLKDSQAIVDAAKSATRVVIVGAGFIGLEVAAALRDRKIDVHVVAPESLPLERVMGPEIGGFVKALHESHGVVFHLGQSASQIDDRTVTLTNGSTLDADLVVMGVGVKPSVALAEQAGLALDRGISVDEHLETSVTGIFAAGDAARWPDARSGDRIRVEHWVVAERQGQAAAKNMLGRREPFKAVPFFWSQHYDTVIHYVGHAERWDRVDVDGTLDGKAKCTVTYMRGGKRLAVATIRRNVDALKAEVAMESE